MFLIGEYTRREGTIIARATKLIILILQRKPRVILLRFNSRFYNFVAARSASDEYNRRPVVSTAQC